MYRKVKIVTSIALALAFLVGMTGRQAYAEGKDIVDTAVEAGSFKTLAAALQAAELVDALKGEGPFTVFAPTDKAFAKLPAGTIESLLKPENRDQLVSVLKYHVVPGRILSYDAVAAKSAGTLQGDDIRVSVSNNQVKINEANVVKPDVVTSNGVIHIIDSVLLPAQKVSAADARQMIEHAIARGVHLFNSGHHAACADLYAETAGKLASQGGDQMPPLVMTSLKTATDHAEQCSCPTQRAWTLRRGLDKAYYALH